jgi:1,4-alpha-glucan branching enzyme
VTADTPALQPIPVERDELDRLIGGAHHDPHSILGPHPGSSAGTGTASGGVTVRVLRPLASAVAVITTVDETEPRTEPQRYALTHEQGGIFVGILPGDTVPDYRLEVTYDGGPIRGDDPYRFLPTLGEVDLHLIGEGRHEQLWDVLGAHVRSYQTASGLVSGVSFAVWAPNAQGVRVVGDLNYWDGRAHPMRSLGASGVWELFIPDCGDGTRYKYEILGQDGAWRQKADPVAFRTEVPPSTASVVFTSTYSWGDDAWLTQRSGTDAQHRPMSIYEVHLGSWRRGLTYLELADELVSYVTDLGFTHVELLPVAEHPFGGSWGYQVSSYFAPTARFGTPDQLRHLIDRLHQAGVGVIVDWVPAHFPKDDWALSRFDGTALYEHADPRRGEQPDWGTLVFDFGRREVRNFLVANAVYWAEQFHVDGLRVDAVASMLYLDYSRTEGQWLPNIHGGRENLDAVAFLQEMTATIDKRVPSVVTIAEESTSWPAVTKPTHLGGLGFGLKWNMGWMNDTLGYLRRDPIHRQHHHHDMTFSMMYAYSEVFVLPISHDEVVHGKGSLLSAMPGDRWQQLANVRALLGYMWAHPGKQLLFMGCEFAQPAEWSEERSLEWSLLGDPPHRGVQSLVRDLNRRYTEDRALWARDTDPGGFQWIDANDAGGNVLSFLRWGDDPVGSDVIACVSNFSSIPHRGYLLGLPYPGRWDEILNTDATDYTGSGVGNCGGVEATSDARHGLPASATLQVPPLATVWLRWRSPAKER